MTFFEDCVCYYFDSTPSLRKIENFLWVIIVINENIRMALSANLVTKYVHAAILSNWNLFLKHFSIKCITEIMQEIIHFVSVKTKKTQIIDQD